MIFYRVEYRTDGGTSAGYSWHTSRADADRAARDAAKSNPDEYADDGPPEVQSFDVTPNKAGILDALNRYASHPNNG